MNLSEVVLLLSIRVNYGKFLYTLLFALFFPLMRASIFNASNSFFTNRVPDLLLKESATTSLTLCPARRVSPTGTSKRDVMPVAVEVPRPAATTGPSRPSAGRLSVPAV